MNSGIAGLLYFGLPALRGLFCGVLFYAGMVVIRSANDQLGRFEKWGLFGVFLIAIGACVFFYGAIGQLIVAARVWSRLPEHYWLVVVSPLIVSAGPAVLGFLWGRRAYKKAYAAAVEGRIGWPESVAVGTR
jgi:hypothetical protein